MYIVCIYMYRSIYLQPTAGICKMLNCLVLATKSNFHCIKQDQQYTYNVTLKRVRATNVAVEKQ